MKPAGQMTLTLTKELEQLVRDEVRKGAFASSGAYNRDLLWDRFLKERDSTEKVKALDAALARGIADADARRVTPVSEAFRRIRTQLGFTEECRQV
jgi:antitoxin ParD1/3/4